MFHLLFLIATSNLASAQIAGVFDEALFSEFFPNATTLYTYASFVEATAKFPKFCADGTADQNKRELAAFLAQTAHESDDYAATEEYRKDEYPDNEYCENGIPCVGRYHGRGPIQLSWNYNYRDCGTFLELDLLNQPDLAISTGKISFETALWFWMTPHQGKKDSIHNLMVADAGFSETTDISNGGLECGTSPKNPDSEQKRIDRFTQFCTKFGVSVGDKVTCQTAAFNPPLDGTERCGIDIIDAIGKCGTICDGTNTPCPDGEKCFGSLSTTICDPNAFKVNRTSTVRCGDDIEHAMTSCGATCEGTFLCPGDQECFAQLPLC